MPCHALLLLRLRLRLRLEVREEEEADVEEGEEEDGRGGLWCSAVCHVTMIRPTYTCQSAVGRENVLLARVAWECTSVLSHARTTHGASSSSSSSSS